MTDRYAHIEYKPAETAHRTAGDPELVAIQKEPVQSYHLQPKPTTVVSRSKPQSLPSSVTTEEQSYLLQLEEITEVSKPEISYQRSKTSTSFTTKSYSMEAEPSSAVPKFEFSHKRSKTLESYTTMPHVAQSEQISDSTTRHDIPAVTGGITRKQSYFMAVNETPVVSPERPATSSPADDIDGVLEMRADQEKSFPTDREGSSQIPTGFPTSDAVTHTAVLSGDENQPPRVPILQFSLQHNSEDNSLTVHLIQAEHLPENDIGRASDPFVKLSFESNACECFESKVIRGTLNPRFNQHFKFTNLPSKIHLEKLVFEIYDYDRMSLNDFIGEVRVLLRKELLNGDTITMRVDELARELRV